MSPCQRFYSLTIHFHLDIISLVLHRPQHLLVHKYLLRALLVGFISQVTSRDGGDLWSWGDEGKLVVRDPVVSFWSLLSFVAGIRSVIAVDGLHGGFDLAVVPLLKSFGSIFIALDGVQLVRGWVWHRWVDGLCFLHRCCVLSLGQVMLHHLRLQFCFHLMWMNSIYNLQTTEILDWNFEKYKFL